MPWTLQWTKISYLKESCHGSDSPASNQAVGVHSRKPDNVIAGVAFSGGHKLGRLMDTPGLLVYNYIDS